MLIILEAGYKSMTSRLEIIRNNHFAQCNILVSYFILCVIYRKLCVDTH